MLRYFVAVPLPDAAKDHLVALQPPTIPGTRRIEREELHLTLHFLGELSPQSDDMVRRALARVKVNDFAITVRGLGRFPTEGQPKVLWAGVDCNPALSALHRSVGAALADAIGFRPEDRPYAPHITLARVNGPDPLGVINRYLEENNAFQIRSVLLKHFVLYSGIFVDDIPQYREEAAFHFK